MILLILAENSIQLVPDGTLFFHILLFLVMIAALNVLLYKPVLRVLEERERLTVGRRREARELLNLVDEKLGRYERALREARAEGYRLLERVRAEAMEERQKRLSEVREEIAHLIAREKLEIAKQAEEAQRILEQESRRIAAEIGRHILGRAVGDAPSAQLRF
jgi:F-type H+-transporting ATPase subunit b